MRESIASIIFYKKILKDGIQGMLPTRNLIVRKMTTTNKGKLMSK